MRDEDLQLKSLLLIFVIAMFFMILTTEAANPRLIKRQIPNFLFELTLRLQKMQMGDIVRRRSVAIAKVA